MLLSENGRTLFPGALVHALQRSNRPICWTDGVLDRWALDRWDSLPSPLLPSKTFSPGKQTYKLDVWRVFNPNRCWLVRVIMLTLIRAGSIPQQTNIYAMF